MPEVLSPGCTWPRYPFRRPRRSHNHSQLLEPLADSLAVDAELLTEPRKGPAGLVELGSLPCLLIAQAVVATEGHAPGMEQPLYRRVMP